MRTRIINMLIAAAAALFSAGCSLEIIENVGVVEEGIPVEVTLGIDVVDSDVVTRAAQASQYEYKVDNLYVYVFDSSGAVIYQHFFDVEGAGEDRYGNPVELTTSNGSDYAEGTVSFKTVTVNDAKILAVANVTRKGVTETAYTITEQMLDDVSTYSDLQSLVMKAQQSIFRGGLFMMTGTALDNSTGSGLIDITPSADQLDCTIYLDRSDAKVEFNVKTGTAGAGITDLTFTPSLWRVKRVPLESLVIPAAGKYADGALVEDADVADAATYFDTEWRSFEIVGKGSDPSGFTFYMPENRQAPRALIYGDSIDEVKMREEQDSTPLSPEEQEQSNLTRPGHRFNNGDFTYADENATYVEISGVLSYNEENGAGSTFVNVMTEFTVHLGQTFQSGVYNPNNYETNRNTHYIYNITVNGANDVEVEVLESTDAEEKEVNPGYKGEVIKNSSMVYELDSHFERRVFPVDRYAIASDMTWGVSTIYSNGIHNPASPTPEKGLRDYKWVKFAINLDHIGSNEAEFSPYPGNSHYYDPDGAEGAVNGKYVYPEGYALSESTVNSKRLYDIHQLVNRLKEIVANGENQYFDRDGHIWITAFVDEYVYYKDPVTYLNMEGTTDPDGYKSMWKTGINANDRHLHFITTDANYSPDGESSVVNTVYTFSQKSIKSLYRTDSDVEIVWGIEHLQEGDRFPTTGHSNLYNERGLSSDLNAGRANTIHWWRGNLEYDDVMDNSQTMIENGIRVPDPYAVKDSYSYIPYACVNRNRDENGNGVIDESEVRWYLASVRNISDFFIGQYCFDQSEFLYPGPEEAIERNAAEGNILRNGYFTDNITWQYGTSSVKSGYCDIFWAEEGCATGSYDYSHNTLGVDIYAYRCVRDLGADYVQSNTVVPDDLYDAPSENETVRVGGVNYTVKTIDLSRYNPISLRSNHETMPLPTHTEMGSRTLSNGTEIHEAGNSRCYESFQYIVSAPGNQTGKYTFSGQPLSNADFDDPCPDGWRMPNIRELCVMSMLEPSGWSSFASTRFSLQDYYTSNNYSSYRPGFEFSQSNFSTQLGGGGYGGYGGGNWDNLGTRCVRDYNGQ